MAWRGKRHHKRGDCFWARRWSLDGRRAVLSSDDRTLKVLDPETGADVAIVSCYGAAHCCALATERMVVVGDASGRVHFLSLEL